MLAMLMAWCLARSGAVRGATLTSGQHLMHAASASVPAPVPQRQGALFRISGAGQQGYLFGTVHAGASTFYPLAPELSRALDSASALVVELDTRADAAFQRAVAAHGSYPRGDDVRRHLAPDTLTRLTQALHAAGISLSSVAQLKPWLLANLLMGLELQRNGYQRSFGIETFLLARAQAHGTAVTELESADYQLALFDTLGAADGERYLRDALRELADGSALRKARAVMAAWSSGDSAALDAVMADATADASLMAQFTRHTLLDRRNPEMADGIERILRGPHRQDSRAEQGKSAGTTFIGVGLLHLLGDNGLPQLLRQRGFQVERVY